MRRVVVSGMALLTMARVGAETSDTHTHQDAPSVLSPPVVVEASEPRYVAPTTRDRIGRIWAPVMINGKGPYRLVLDTGANRSAIVDDVAQQLGVAQHPSKRAMLHGLTGSAVVPIVQVDSLEVGDIYLDGASLPIVADVFGGADGVLGPESLDGRRIFIDFGNDLITIERSRGSVGGEEFGHVPVKFTADKLLVFEIQVGTVRATAILDTGAQYSLGNDALRAALLHRKPVGTDRTIIGVTLDEQYGKSVVVREIDVGGFRVRNMEVTFGDVYIFERMGLTAEPAMLIGMDFLGTLDALVIDYKRRELLFRPKRWLVEQR